MTGYGTREGILAAKLIAVANMKGGVGKTATVVGVAEALAANAVERTRSIGAAPQSVLVMDLDAQSSASFALAGEGRLKELMSGARTIDAFIAQVLLDGLDLRLLDYVAPNVSDVTHFGEPLPLSLIAASPHLRSLERGLVHALTRNGLSLDDVEFHIYQLLSGSLGPVRERFDYILFDCPPGISTLGEVAIRISDLTIVPTIPDYLSLLGMDAFSKNVWNEFASANPKLPVPNSLPHVLLSKVRNAGAHKTRAADLRANVAGGRAGYHAFKTQIPDSLQVPKALERTDVHPDYARKWGDELTTHFSDLVLEIDQELGVR